MQHGFLYYNWGNVASVVGLVLGLIGIWFTIRTLQTARSAERAALDAKHDAATHAFVNDARRAEGYLRDIVTHLRHNRLGDAIYRSSDLLVLIGEMNEILPQKRIGAEGLEAFMLQAKDECEQNDKVIRRFSSGTEPPVTKELERMITRANSAHAAVVKIRVGVTPE